MKHPPPRLRTVAEWAEGSAWLPRLSPEQLDRLSAFAILLADRAVPLGLIAESDRERVLERHVLDCLRALAAVRHDDACLVDLGSGAGLPGLALGIALPDRQLILLEPRHRAAGFLELAAHELQLPNVSVRAERVEDSPVQADLATARAFADLAGSWAAACRVLRRGGRLVYFAGSTWDGEAGAIEEPERPAAWRADRVVETSSPLVMMDRSH